MVVFPLVCFFGFWLCVYCVGQAFEVYLPAVIPDNVILAFGYMQWQTELLNRPLERLGARLAAPWRAWFTLGAWFGLVAMVLSVVVLLSNFVFWAFSVYTLMFAFPMETGQVGTPAREQPSVAPSMEPMLTPIIPGVNLPFDQLGYYMIALFITAVVHELGHAIAAASESVRILGFGFGFWAVSPGGFVNLHERDLVTIAPFRQLRVYCAGAWHNVVLAVVCWLLLLLLPAALSPAYLHLGGAGVISVEASSFLAAHVHVGDVITGVNGAAISGVKSWEDALVRSLVEPPESYCVDTSLVEGGDVHNSSCCTAPSRLQCFVAPSRISMCAPAKEMMSRRLCGAGRLCPEHETCVSPVLEANTTRLLLVHVRRADAQEELHYAGHPGSLYHALSVSDYSKRWQWCPASLPTWIDRTATFVTTFSSAMALLNLAPVYYLDGHRSCAAAIELLLPGSPRKRKDDVLGNMLLCGSLLFIANVIVGVLAVLLA